ncbi:peptide chain release factor N(5)-glutamine methyltransferase [Mycobacterium sp.]|uniref:peptide chain release factor N(5)-glutamine methyltransferase n=1 Tax=Mycobacterium sp. TaxID=1785 RepID=UPI002BB5CC7F|nr:peptide chain release factor N(5)-glutamine methyltransferase [Mycobacterium sp.]HME48895.1 peptide chain release factor N(5)-glutamine methyltransferase [Mycobacterium sp.]
MTRTGSAREAVRPATVVLRAIDEATARLAGAGVASPRRDAEELAAYVVGISRGRLALIDSLADDFAHRYAELVAARSRRIPLQHLIGTAAFGPVTLQVGPGVFVPRPETEALLEWAVRRRLGPSPVIVDLCTGSGALAVALARRLPAARVVAVDDSADALHYARRNSAGTAIDVREGDVTDPALFADLDGSVDLVVANPPYLPDAADVEPEVAQHDPPAALFGGPDGMAVIEPIVALGARWLKPGGLLAVEHDDTASEATKALLRARFDEIVGHTDFAGRPRFVTARRRTAR